jgi:hypothetical protein
MLPDVDDRLRPDQKLYDDKSIQIDSETIHIQGARDNFVILRRDRKGREIWRFAANDRSLHVDGNYYSYRLHRGHIFIILGDAPNYVPIKASEPLYVKTNPANYHMGILDVSSGECRIYPLANAQQRTECRIEAIRDDRILVSCDRTQLAEYRIAT